jgi:hypothetical protein
MSCTVPTHPGEFKDKRHFHFGVHRLKTLPTETKGHRQEEPAGTPGLKIHREKPAFA